MNVPYRKVPQGWGTNPYKLPPTDLGLLYTMSVWSGVNETDGILTHAQALACCQITQIGSRNESRHLRRMVKRGALSRLENGSYRIVDYCDNTHEERVANRQRDAERQRRHRAKKPTGVMKADDEVTTVRRRTDDLSRRDIAPFGVVDGLKPDELSRDTTQHSEAVYHSFAGDASPLGRDTPADEPETDDVDWASPATAASAALAGSATLSERLRRAVVASMNGHARLRRANGPDKWLIEAPEIDKPRCCAGQWSRGEAVAHCITHGWKV